MINAAPPEPESFAAALRRARTTAGISRKVLAARVGASTTEIGFWETGTRTPSPERQQQILAACCPQSPAVAGLVAALERDIAARLRTFAADLEAALKADEQKPL